jgi:hypothetical protein
MQATVQRKGVIHCCLVALLLLLLVLLLLLLQVNEAKRHAPGLSVVVYDGLKWQRSQAEAAARKQLGR